MSFIRMNFGELQNLTRKKSDEYFWNEIGSCIKMCIIEKLDEWNQSKICGEKKERKKITWKMRKIEKRKKRVRETERRREIREKDKDLLNNYLVSMIFYDIIAGNGLT